MTGTHGSEYLPDDFFVDVDTNTTRALRSTTELIEARDMAIERPGTWVRVGLMRTLAKDPSAWCSEVNTNKKVALRNCGGIFNACWWPDDDTDDVYGKALRFTPDSVVK